MKTEVYKMFENDFNKAKCLLDKHKNELEEYLSEHYQDELIKEYLEDNNKRLSVDEWYFGCETLNNAEKYAKNVIKEIIYDFKNDDFKNTKLQNQIIDFLLESEV